MDTLSALFTVAMVTSSSVTAPPECVILNYGILAPQEQIGSRETPGTASGSTREFEALTIAQRTDKIPARLGLRFGVDHVFKHVPDNGQLEAIVSHPPMTTSKGVLSISRASKDPTDSGTSYGFDYPYELLPGQWVFEFRYRGKLLCKQAFVVFPE